MNVDLQLAKELIEAVRGDMEEIALDLQKNDFVNTIQYPYSKLYHDIGRCSGWLQEHEKRD